MIQVYKKIQSERFSQYWNNWLYLTLALSYCVFELVVSILFRISSQKTNTSVTKFPSTKKKTKKKKSKKKSAQVKLLPKLGPWLSVFHAANVGVDNMSTSADGDLLLHETLLLLGK